MKLRDAIRLSVVLLVASIVVNATAQQAPPPAGRGGGNAPPPIVWPSPPLPASPIVLDTGVQHQIRLFVTPGLNQDRKSVV